ncbi:MAG TPA: MraY family glycosyltransferase [Chthonomonadales bacterium]|nr:MraY family glycosyltransferase [Chthonomonadales bacterium]
MILLTLSFAIALLTTLVTTPWVLKLAVRYGAIAVPRARDVHEEPKPRWGGIAIVVGVMAAVLVTVTIRHYRPGVESAWTMPLVGLLVAGAFIAIVGLIDDLKDLRAIWQALGIVTAGAILIAFGVRIDGVTNPFVALKTGPYHPGQWIALPAWASVAATLVWVFVVTKTVDAIDGLDGLAAGVCAIAAATLALLGAASLQPGGPTLALVAAAVSGACIGFLRYNYSPARIFMSTVGAQFLGLMLAAISIMGAFKLVAAISVLIPLLVLGVPLLDYAIVLLRRLRSGAPLTHADNRHLHHRLMASGLSKKQAVWVIYACTAVLCVTAIILFEVSRPLTP